MMSHKRYRDHHALGHPFLWKLMDRWTKILKPLPVKSDIIYVRPFYKLLKWMTGRFCKSKYAVFFRWSNWAWQSKFLLWRVPWEIMKQKINSKFRHAWDKTRYWIKFHARFLTLSTTPQIDINISNHNCHSSK